MQAQQEEKTGIGAMEQLYPFACFHQSLGDIHRGALVTARAVRRRTAWM